MKITRDCWNQLLLKQPLPWITLACWNKPTTQIDRLAALHDIDLVINSSLDLRVTLNILLDQVVEKLNV